MTSVKTPGFASPKRILARTGPAAPNRVLGKAGPVLIGLIVLLAVTSGACAARGGVPRPFPGASLPPGAGEAPADRVETPPADVDPLVEPATPPASAAVVATALEYRGAPYRNGGSDPSGFDCSGFVQYVFARHGTVLPREVRDQYHAGRKIDLDDVKAGDLIFFETVGRGASHVGLALGDGRFVHAPSSRGIVRVERYTASYWAERFVGARRVADVTASGARSSAGSVPSSR